MKRLRVMVLMHEDLVPPQTLDGLDPKERWAAVEEERTLNKIYIPQIEIYTVD